MSSSAASASSAALAIRHIIYLGMDVHKDSSTVSVLPDGGKAPTRFALLPNDLPKLRMWSEGAGCARGRRLRVLRG